ncbi:MAG: DUF2997 domain-containing protein [Litorilinea sp.]
MEKQEIEIAIGPDGKIEYTITGVRGPACDSISALLEQLGHVEQSERTADWYVPDAESTLNIQQNQ